MTNPTLITTPFAENGDKNTIPESVGAEPQNATMQAGFPPITQQKISEGGIPPERNDFNGMFNLVTQHLVHLNNGMSYEFDQEHANKIGGYPLNARIMLDNGDIVRSTIANNTTNPNLDMTGWELPQARDVFDASGKNQQEINDFVKSLRNFNVKDYFTTGMTNHTQAFSDCVTACIAAGGGKITIPFGNYIVGKQTKGNGVNTSAFTAAPIVKIDAPNLDFVIEIQGANIKFDDGLYFGGWDVSVNPPVPYDAIIAAGSSTAPIQKYYSYIGTMFEFVAANSITLIGSGTLDGNMENVNLGGIWGDTGYQCWGNAFKIQAIKTLVFDAAIEAKNFPLDGMYVGVPNSVTDSSFSINGFNTHSNARQGLSLTGGRNGEFTNCKFNNIGNGSFSSLPKTGVDIEAEVGEVRNIVFEACEIKDNARAGVDDSAEINPINGVEFKNCTLQSLSQAAPSVIARRSKFKGCHFFGVAKIAERTKSQDIPVFEDNYFFDKSTGDEVSQIINYGGAANANAIFRGNNFYLSRKNAWFYPYGSGKWTFTDNKFYLLPTIPNSLTQITLDNETGNEIEFMGNELIDLRTDAAAPTITIWYPLYRKFVGNNITSTQNKMRFRWDGGTQSFNNVPRLDEARGVLTLAKNRIGSASSLSQTATITFEAAMPTSTVLAPNNFLNYFSKGSVVFNSAVASTSAKGWVCISEGYPCANAWVASTAYSVSAGNSGYVFANNKVYKCKVAGTSSSTAPNHSSGDATDGTVTWTYIGTLATFAAFGAAGAAVANATDTTNVVVQLNALLSSLRTAGVIQP